MKKTIFINLFLAITITTIYGQDSVLNKPTPYVIKNINAYCKSVKSHPEKKLVDLKKIINNIHFDIRYASRNNFMHTKLYPPLTTSYLRLPAAEALKNIQKELNDKGLALKIYDAYRPYYVTVKMWQPIKDERYVANPAKGSGHNRGTAVDLTIIKIADGEELNMGTGYDNFTDTAHHTFQNLSAGILKNRILLKTIMEKHGFKALESEWWHYSLVNAANFELMDLSFKKLKKLTGSKNCLLINN